MTIRHNYLARSGALIRNAQVAAVLLRRCCARGLVLPLVMGCAGELPMQFGGPMTRKAAPILLAQSEQDVGAGLLVGLGNKPTVVYDPNFAGSDPFVKMWPLCDDSSERHAGDPKPGLVYAYFVEPIDNIGWHALLALTDQKNVHFLQGSRTAPQFDGAVNSRLDPKGMRRLEGLVNQYGLFDSRNRAKSCGDLESMPMMLYLSDPKRGRSLAGCASSKTRHFSSQGAVALQTQLRKLVDPRFDKNQLIEFDPHTTCRGDRKAVLEEIGGYLQKLDAKDARRTQIGAWLERVKGAMGLGTSQ